MQSGSTQKGESVTCEPFNEIKRDCFSSPFLRGYVGIGEDKMHLFESRVTEKGFKAPDLHACPLSLVPCAVLLNKAAPCITEFSYLNSAFFNSTWDLHLITQKQQQQLENQPTSIECAYRVPDTLYVLFYLFHKNSMR